MDSEKPSLWSLYISFVKIGGLTFGGGLAMLPMLQKEVVEKHHWATEDDLLDCYAVGQCTPGIIAVNTATMLGYRKRGILGGIVATLGEVTPSLVIITFLSALLKQLEGNLIMEQAFTGIRVAVCVLIAQAILKLYKKSIIDIPTIILCALTIIGTVFLGFSPIWFIFLGITYGLLVQKLKRGKAK
ncbi:chromate transport protein ChrA [Sphaerochaeta pleomorpha str. Grapes]|uniref:Chromate transport protein ChrA n=2 Tax=Sphaerochaeta TaxID=399320 RepID=G8QUZ0_SPHPG|nr:chromate transport protein ChrA [Sphaerochaeta pleomorpha str. Grapes]